MKYVRIFLLTLILIGVGLWVVQDRWVPKVVNTILEWNNVESESADTAIPFLTFIYPASAGTIVDATEVQKIQWSFVDPTALQQFPAEETYVRLELVSSQNKVIGSAGPAPSATIQSTSAFWNINGTLDQSFYTLSSAEKYKIRATLVYEPKHVDCEPSTPQTYGECIPLFTPQQRAFSDKAALYDLSESGLFSIDLSKYVHPEVSIDQTSLSISPRNASLTGTANVESFKLNILQSSKYIVQTTVTVKDGRWSYTPLLPAGEYYIELWGTGGNVSFPGATIVVRGSQ